MATKPPTPCEEGLAERIAASPEGEPSQPGVPAGDPGGEATLPNIWGTAPGGKPSPAGVRKATPTGDCSKTKPCASEAYSVVVLNEAPVPLSGEESKPGEISPGLSAISCRAGKPVAAGRVAGVELGCICLPTNADNLTRLDVLEPKCLQKAGHQYFVRNMAQNSTWYDLWRQMAALYLRSKCGLQLGYPVWCAGRKIDGLANGRYQMSKQSWNTIGSILEYS